MGKSTNNESSVVYLELRIRRTYTLEMPQVFVIVSSQHIQALGCLIYPTIKKKGLASLIPRKR